MPDSHQNRQGPDIRLAIDQRLPRRKGAYLVGGSVRDLMLGNVPSDYDVVVTGNARTYADQTAARCKGRVIRLGRADQTVFRVAAASLIVDVTSAKRSDIITDLSQRDFTVNAMAWEIHRRHLIDPFAGRHDLRSRSVRMINAHGFAADPLRLLRAFRLCATMGFSIERYTWQALCGQHQRIRASAGERVRSEWMKILTVAGSHGIIAQMAESGLLEALLAIDTCPRGAGPQQPACPGLRPAHLDRLKQLETFISAPDLRLSSPTAHWVQNLASSTVAMLKFSLLLQGRHSQRPSRTRAAHLAGLADQLAERMRLSTKEHQDLVALVRHHLWPQRLYLADRTTGLRPDATGLFFRMCGRHAPLLALQALASKRANLKTASAPVDGRQQFYHQLIDTYLARVAAKQGDRLLSGSDLMDAFRLKPSPLFHIILDQVQDLYLGGRLHSRQQALRWVSRYLTTHRPLSR